MSTKAGINALGGLPHLGHWCTVFAHGYPGIGHNPFPFPKKWEEGERAFLRGQTIYF